jgi:cobalt-zinc-cadmium efflux system membrane fusion protein
LPKKDRTKINQNQKVSVFVDGIPDKIFTGNITYIGSVIKSETRTLPVKVLLDNKESILSPGAFIQLNVSTGKKKNSIVIPRTALVEIDKEGTEGKHRHIVYLKKGGHRVDFYYDESQNKLWELFAMLGGTILAFANAIILIKSKK